MADTLNPNLPIGGDTFNLESAALRYLDGTIEAAEMAQLSATLQRDRASRAAFVRLSVAVPQLREIFRAQSGLAWVDTDIKELEFEMALEELVEQASRNAEASPMRIRPERPDAKSRFRPPHWRFYGIAAAILLVISVTTTLLMQQHGNSGSAWSAKGIASIESTMDANWQGSPPAENMPLPQAELNLASGFAILHFDDGARLAIEGPCRFTPQAGGIVLASGNVSARVPPSAMGFTVQTADAMIVDLGTEFGVRAHENGATDLQVFTGRVSIAAAGSTEYVTENAARHVSMGAISTIPFNASEMVRPAQIDRWVEAGSSSPFERWEAWSERSRRDPDMIAYYIFESDGHPAEQLPNLALTGDSFDGTLQGEDGLPTWTTGRWSTKGALEFHGGTTQRVMVADGHGTDRLDFSRGSETAGPFTIAVWVKAAPSQIGGAGLVSRGLGNSDEQFTIDVAEGRYRVFLRGFDQAGGMGSSVSSKLGPNSQWQYVVATYDPVKGVLSLYIDGALAAEPSPAPHMLIPGGTPVSIGSRLSRTKTYIDTLAGSIDEVAIWGRAASADQIRSNYESGKPN